MTGALPAGLDERGLVAEVSARLGSLPEGVRVVVALSGGADSAALALLVRRARPDLALTAVHVRHGLRDDAADVTAARAVAEAVGIGFQAEQVTVARTGEGVEAAARGARYAALERAATAIGAVAVLVGHTADDQAETVLLALGRGTGLRGLSGMRPARSAGAAALLRPLLRLRRDDVRAVAAALPTVEDPTNTDPDQRRWRVRTAVLPALAGLSGGPGDPVALLTRLADLARDDADLLDELAAAEADHLVRAWGPVRVLRRDALATLPAALARRVLRGLAAGLDAAAVDRVLALPADGAVTVHGGLRVEAGGGWLTVAPGDLADLRSRDLPVPGAIDLPEIGLRVVAGDREAADGTRLPPRARLPRGAASAAETRLGDAAEGGLVVRARRPGDLVPGTRRPLADRLSDLGVPRALRGLVPVVTLAGRSDEVVWVPGIAAPGGPGGGVRVRLG